MIWHSSTKFGCGKARSRSGKVIAVAYYEPKGNVPGRFHDNVIPPVIESDDETDAISDEQTTNTMLSRMNIFRLISCQ